MGMWVTSEITGGDSLHITAVVKLYESFQIYQIIEWDLKTPYRSLQWIFRGSRYWGLSTRSWARLLLLTCISSPCFLFLICILGWAWTRDPPGSAGIIALCYHDQVCFFFFFLNLPYTLNHLYITYDILHLINFSLEKNGNQTCSYALICIRTEIRWDIIRKSYFSYSMTWGRRE